VKLHLKNIKTNETNFEKEWENLTKISSIQTVRISKEMKQKIKTRGCPNTTNNRSEENI
jgi:hypothetical protein